MVRILAIDPSSTAVGMFDGVRATTLDLNKKRPRADRLSTLLAELNWYFNTHDDVYDFVVYEEQFVRGDGATRALYGAVGVIEAVCAPKAGIMAVPQAKVRSWVAAQLGKKKLPKGEVKGALEKVAKLYYSEVDFKTEHEFDAGALLAYVKVNGVIE